MLKLGQLVSLQPSVSRFLLAGGLFYYLHKLVEGCSALFIAGAGMRRSLGNLFYFSVELEDSGAPAAPVLN